MVAPLRAVCMRAWLLMRRAGVSAAQIEDEEMEEQ